MKHNVFLQDQEGRRILTMKDVRDFSVAPGNPNAASFSPNEYVYWDALDGLEEENSFTGLASRYGIMVPGC
jgi:hypothetical protein